MKTYKIRKKKSQLPVIQSTPLEDTDRQVIHGSELLAT